MKRNLLVLAISLLFMACTVKPSKINYGSDHCHFCDMTIVDKTHASQYVTKKGKAYMFDAIECMVNDLSKNNNEDNMAFILVSDYNKPGTLINAKEATFLISEKIKSPMGANLSAFNSKKIAEKYLQENGGKLFTWEQLKVKLSQ
ncbi:MAG TPA: hypothetical protein ENK46_11025 [Flavobacteriia bacterium]|nr:hypothetical protein [Flavobacteriia bacterium]